MPISDLTNTTWVIKGWLVDDPYEYMDGNLDYTINADINFSSNGATFSDIQLSCWYEDDGDWASWACDIFYGQTQVASGDTGGVVWVNAAFQTIEITGGTDVTNSDLISWLEAYATLQQNTPKVSIDLSTLSGWASVQNGQHSLTLRAKATGYYDSELSTPVSFRKGPAGITVAISGENENSAFPTVIYDGQSTTAPIVFYNNEAASYSGEVVCTSGYLLVEVGTAHPNYSYGTPSGGVTSLGDGLFRVESSGAITGICSTPCFVAGTPILLADGTTKPVEDITYDDVLLVWNFYEGKLDSAKPCWIMNERVTTQYKKVTLSNGIVLKLVGSGDNCHRLFNVTKQKMLYANECVGDEVYTLDGIATVLSCEKIYETVKYYNLTTDRYLDCFADRVLTGSRLNNMYNIENMKYTDDIRLISEEEEAERWRVRAAANGGIK